MKLIETDAILNERTKMQTIFEEFIASGNEKMEVIPEQYEYATVQTFYASLHTGAKRWAKGKVRVVMLDGRVYLVRCDK